MLRQQSKEKRRALSPETFNALEKDIVEQILLIQPAFKKVFDEEDAIEMLRRALTNPTYSGQYFVDRNPRQDKYFGVTPIIKDSIPYGLFQDRNNGIGIVQNLTREITTKSQLRTNYVLFEHKFLPGFVMNTATNKDNTFRHMWNNQLSETEDLFKGEYAQTDNSNSGDVEAWRINSAEHKTHNHTLAKMYGRNVIKFGLIKSGMSEKSIRTYFGDLVI